MRNSAFFQCHVYPFSTQQLPKHTKITVVATSFAFLQEISISSTELIELGINETNSVELLATLCCASRTCARTAHWRHLYRKINDSRHVSFIPGRELSFDAHDQGAAHDIELTNSHMRPYTRAVCLIVDHPRCQDQRSINLLTGPTILERVKTSNIDHSFLQIGGKTAMPAVSNRRTFVRNIARLLASSSMRSFSVDLFMVRACNGSGQIVRSFAKR